MLEHLAHPDQIPPVMIPPAIILPPEFAEVLSKASQKVARLQDELEQLEDENWVANRIKDIETKLEGAKANLERLQNFQDRVVKNAEQLRLFAESKKDAKRTLKTVETRHNGAMMTAEVA